MVRIRKYNLSRQRRYKKGRPDRIDALVRQIRKDAKRFARDVERQYPRRFVRSNCGGIATPRFHVGSMVPPSELYPQTPSPASLEKNRFSVLIDNELDVVLTQIPDIAHLSSVDAFNLRQVTTKSFEDAEWKFVVMGRLNSMELPFPSLVVRNVRQDVRVRPTLISYMYDYAEAPTNITHLNAPPWSVANSQQDRDKTYFVDMLINSRCDNPDKTLFQIQVDDILSENGLPDGCSLTAYDIETAVFTVPARRVDFARVLEQVFANASSLTELAVYKRAFEIDTRSVRASELAGWPERVYRQLAAQAAPR